MAILTNRSISPMARILYGVIVSLCNTEGYCWASNKYFADLFLTKKDTVSAWIGELSTANYIRVELRKEEGFKRHIHLSDILPIGLKGGELSDKNPIGTGKKPDTLPEKNPIAIGEKPDHNNISNNKADNKTDSASAVAPASDAQQPTPVVKEEKKEIPTPPTPSPAEPEKDLRQHCLDYYHKQPDKYTPEMYAAFINYWSAPIQNSSKKSEIGKPRWKTEKTWDLAGRLASWFSREKPSQQSNGKQFNNSRRAGPIVATLANKPASEQPGTVSRFNQRVS
ncbi:helix-turn-helix protein [Spirosoma oryzae]|uniref:Helix-turn-helix protein n=1 Tax=Spirosoma oryzae TaxID=1469603 RepID=A0A2T0T573_9BACT|nr:helix-turn-helix domain-containing protein [Spirosoma oryzae]PRY40828.1 helix-turn-helix protein [Spirosoma oryzae]